MKKTLLEGLRVLEISHAVAGPTASQILADYGAEVVKIERPDSGDIFRNLPGMGPAMFLAVNRGKKSVCVDLKTPEGLRIFFRLAGISDVIVENLGPGVAESLGISYAKVRRINRRIVYCKVESFGAGPNENVPAFDPVLQAAAGIMSTTGFPPDRYVRAGVSVVDMSTGMHAANAILASLLAGRKGIEIRVPLFDAAAYFMSYWVALYDLERKDTKPLGSTHIFGAPYNLFKTRDGFVYIAIANDAAWKAFCKAFSFDELLENKLYQTNSDRVKRKEELETLLSKRLENFQADEISRKLKDTGVPYGKLNTAKSLLEDAHFLSRDILKSYSYGGRNFRTIVNPSVISGRRLFAAKSPPDLGADTSKILRSLLKMKPKEVSRLRKMRVIS